MADYKEMYFQLFNKLTDVIEKLKEIQCKMEDMYSDESFVDEEWLHKKIPYPNWIGYFDLLFKLILQSF